jgi:hypothetical protein
MTAEHQTLLRFVVANSHPDTGLEEGIFRAAHDLRDGTSASALDREFLDTLLSWFDANLAKPERFNSSRSKGYYRRKTAGISWLKPAAVEHLARMRELAGILERNGIRVSQITTDRPGYVVFEDDHQIVAEPFRGERRRS